MTVVYPPSGECKFLHLCNKYLKQLLTSLLILFFPWKLVGSPASLIFVSSCVECRSCSVPFQLQLDLSVIQCKNRRNLGMIT